MYLLVGLVPGWSSIYLLSLWLYNVMQKRIVSQAVKFFTLITISLFMLWVVIIHTAFSAMG